MIFIVCMVVYHIHLDTFYLTHTYISVPTVVKNASPCNEISSRVRNMQTIPHYLYTVILYTIYCLYS